MIAGCAHRLGILIVGLALLLGPVAHASMLAVMAGQMATASVSEMTMPEGCDRCVDQSQDSAAMTCAAPCAFPGAVLSNAPVIQPIALAQPTGPVRSTPVDRHPLPDPYPPKLI